MRSSDRSIRLGCSAVSRATIASIGGVMTARSRVRRNRQLRLHARRRRLGQQPAQFGERRAQLVPMHHHVDHAVLGEIFGALESTTYPGTTREVMLPILEKSGLKAGKDFYLAFSPVREDPGRKDYSTKTIPKVVGGYDKASLAAAVAAYELAID